MKSVRIRSFSGPYSVRMWKNTDQKSFKSGQFSRSVIFRKIIQPWYNLSLNLFLSCFYFLRKIRIGVLKNMFSLKKEYIWHFWRFCQLHNAANLMLRTEIEHIHIAIFLFGLCKLACVTAQKMKFSIMDFFSKCDQIRKFLRIWSHLLKKSLMENLIFLCSVYNIILHLQEYLAPWFLRENFLWSIVYGFLLLFYLQKSVVTNKLYSLIKSSY